MNEQQLLKVLLRKDAIRKAQRQLEAYRDAMTREVKERLRTLERSLESLDSARKDQMELFDLECSKPDVDELIDNPLHGIE